MILVRIKKGIGKIYDPHYCYKIYEGEILNGEKNGKGKEFNIDNEIIFEGEYKKGLKNGKGKEFSSDNNDDSLNTDLIKIKNVIENAEKKAGNNSKKNKINVCKLKKGNNEFQNQYQYKKNITLNDGGGGLNERSCLR